MADIAKIELGDTTYDIKDASARSDIDAITDHDAEDNIYVKTSQLEVNGTSTLIGDITTDGTITSKSNQVIQTLLIDRDGDIPSDTVWGPTQKFIDKDGENIGYLQIYQANTTSGSIGLSLQVYNENTDGTNTVGNHLRLAVAKDGTCYYNVTDPSAFRTAIDAQVAGNYVTRNVVSDAWIQNYGGADQHWGVGAIVANTNNSTYKNHSTTMIARDTDVALYDGTTRSFLWSAYTTQHKPTYSDVGAAAASHKHSGSDINSGYVGKAYGGTGSDNTSRAINTVFAGPSSGSAGNASWRKLVAADIPELSAAKITSGTLPIARGGTGATTVVNARKALFGSNLNTTAQYLIGITESWEDGGYVSFKKASATGTANTYLNALTWHYINIAGFKIAFAHGTTKTLAVTQTTSYGVYQSAIALPIPSGIFSQAPYGLIGTGDVYMTMTPANKSSWSATSVKFDITSIGPRTDTGHVVDFILWGV